MGVGQQIRSARKNAGMTQAELAKKLGIPFQSISQWERETRNPKIDTLERIADALGVHILDLMGIGQELDGYTCEISLDDGATQEDVERLKNLVTAAKGKTFRDVYDWLPDEEKEKFWRNVVDPFRAELDKAFNALNERGQGIAVERVKELGKIDEYRRQDTPQQPSPGVLPGQPAPPPSPEGKDTPEQGTPLESTENGG